MADSVLTRARRITRFVLQTNLVDVNTAAGMPRLAPFVLRHGLGVRTVHHVHALQHPHRTALTDARRSLTYRQADEEINRICRAFQAMGVRRGDRAILCFENRVEYMLFWFAGFRAGISIVHASYRSTAAELHYLATHSKAAVIVCSQRTAPAVRELLEAHEIELIVVDDVGVHPRQHRYPEWSDRHDSDFFAVDSAAAGDNVVYTSGTTGKPKGAVRNFSNVGVAELSRIGERLPVRAADRHLVVCPLYHSGAQAFAAMMTSLGCTLVLLEKFDAEATLEAMARWRIHSTFMVPTMIRRIVELPAEIRNQHPTPELRALVSGAAAFPHALRLRAIAAFGASSVHDFYGATELGWITLIDGDEMLERPGSVGRGLEGHELQITNADREVLPTGEVGTIWARNEQTMEGYLHDEQASEDSRDADWITVDDLGYLDEDGYLYLAGRDRDMVISGGVNIYPVEIEEVLAQHEGVEEVAVIGLPDTDLGERLTAVVAGEVDFDELAEFARGKLAAHKVPRRWELIGELPRNPTGKVLKRELRERYGGAQ